MAGRCSIKVPSRSKRTVRNRIPTHLHGPATSLARNLALRRTARPLNLTAMSRALDPSPPTADLRVEAGDIHVDLGGDWRITRATPQWSTIIAGQTPGRVLLHAQALGRWDSALVLFVEAAVNWCRVEGVYCDFRSLPAAVGDLVAQLEDKTQNPLPASRTPTFSPSSAWPPPIAGVRPNSTPTSSANAC